MKSELGRPIIDTSPTNYLLGGTVLLAIAGALFVNLNEDPETFAVFTMLAAGPALYMLIAGAVARGIEVARSLDSQ